MNVAKFHSPSNSRGFTLIELLVVIAIIGLLASVVLAALNIAREKGYDARRFSDLRQVQTALESYYADNGSYPLSISATKFNSNCIGPYNTVTAATNNANLIPGLVPNYIPSLPEGPQMNATLGYDCYDYKSNGTDYKFMDYNPQLVGGAIPSGSLNDPNYYGVAWSVYSSPYAGANF